MILLTNIGHILQLDDIKLNQLNSVDIGEYVGICIP